MPGAQTILAQLTAIANEAMAVAIAWHILIAVAIVALARGWRPSRRLTGVLLAAPIASAAAVAIVFRNPFNGAVLAALALALVALASRARPDPVVLGPLWIILVGALIVAFGLLYPHFLAARSAWTYLYAAPTGLVPCPTLSVVIGLALISGGPRVGAWSLGLGGVGLFYGVFGVLHLEVLLDLPLILGAIALIAVAWRDLTRKRSVGGAIA